MEKDFIKETIFKIYKNNTVEYIQKLIDLIKGTNVIVPTTYKISTKDIDNLLSKENGEKIKIEENILFDFNYIENDKGEVLLPIFSTFQEIGKEISTMSIYIDDLLEHLYYKKAVKGIVINPFTSPIEFKKEQFKYFITLNSEEILIYYHDKYKGDIYKINEDLEGNEDFNPLEVRKTVNELKTKYDIYTIIDNKNKPLFKDNTEKMVIYKEKTTKGDVYE